MVLEWLLIPSLRSIVYDTCEAIAQEYTEEVMPTPKTQEAWKEVAEEFLTSWNFRNPLGAIDGKHVAIKCPRNSGSFYYNYKGFYSIILLAIVDAAYKFLCVDIWVNGSCSDGGVFKDCDIFI
ncbi:putative nuclease HARBI1 [Mizuhopecten yessoensis]|uniref:putative nuclease HARBI1 n=1 Tax=Mizuhopecten yessoensis TaxID=6573 RepID=UPI000B45960C|nr:putative nuclease HARBI1 [Mizuhopecten yessoensis]